MPNKPLSMFKMNATPKPRKKRSPAMRKAAATKATREQNLVKARKALAKKRRVAKKAAKAS